jgi:hypothetical protein
MRRLRNWRKLKSVIERAILSLAEVHCSETKGSRNHNKAEKVEKVENVLRVIERAILSLAEVHCSETKRSRNHN